MIYKAQEICLVDFFAENKTMREFKFQQQENFKK